MEILISSIKHCKYLLVLVIKENVIDSFNSISNLLSFHKSITHFDLTINRCSQNLLELYEGLIKTTNLEHLNLSNCNFLYFCDFFKFLSKNSSIVFINLNYNTPKDLDQTFTDFCTELKENFSLKLN